MTFIFEAIKSLQLKDHEALVEELNASFESNLMGVLSWDDIWESCQPLYKCIDKKEFKWNATPDMSPEAFKAMVHQMYDTADTNSDEVLVEEEFQDFMKFIFEAIGTLQLRNHETLVEELNASFESNLMGVLCWDDIWESCEPLYHCIKKKEFAWKAEPDITQDQFKAMIRQIYDAADTNKDGDM